MTTPTPWMAKQKYNNEDLYQLFTVKSPKPTTRLEVRIDWDKEGGFTKDDASLIVRAVNSYQAMKKALFVTTNAVEFMLECHREGIIEATGLDAIKQLEMHLANARHALT